MRRASTRISGGRCDRAGLLEDERAVPGLGPDGVALLELALEQAQRERVLEHPLDRALQWAGAVGGVPAGRGEHFLRIIRQLERERPLGEPLAQPRELEVDDRAELLPRERMELDDLV